ncbi:hypothetical protein [Nostoc sp. DedQUE09]|uniref:hypothetical protein n=1 Tax=Nostoc sp. DedQUE09 TaxID=3075394 RepID=UPI002AD40C85|nr:hypothetical protein [Nostoc sp. DedQUE09]MDZ7952739.1 hypothetical protein [Nostoc sp. DedQUE09]
MLALAHSLVYTLKSLMRAQSQYKSDQIYRLIVQSLENNINTIIMDYGGLYVQI